MSSITATSIEKYVGSTEGAVRQGLNQATSGILSYSGVESQQAVVDIVALSDRADTLMFTYGADARVAGQKAALKAGVDETALSRVGQGADSSLAAPTTSTNSRTLENGTVRTTELTTLARTIDNTAADQNGGVGMSRVYSETVSRDLDGYAKAGTSLAATERSETSVTTTTADVANRTKSITTESQAVIRTEGSSITVSEQRLRSTVISLRNDGSIEQIVREKYLSVSTDADGAIVGTSQRDSSETTLMDKAGNISVTRMDQSVTASVDAKGTTNTVSSLVNTTISIASEGDKVGAVAITEGSSQAASRVAADGSFVSASATERTSKFGGVGTTATSASTLVMSDATWLKADGAVGGGSVERYSTFAVDNGALVAADGYVKSANILLRTDNKVEVKATSDAVQANGAGQNPTVTSATAINAVGNNALTITPTDTKGKGKGAAPAQVSGSGPQMIVDGSKVTLTVSDGKGKGNAGPTVVLDMLTRQVTATSRNGYSANVDGIAGVITASGGNGAKQVKAYADRSAQSSTVGNTNGVGQVPLSVQAKDGEFALAAGNSKKTGLVYSPVSVSKVLSLSA